MWEYISIYVIFKWITFFTKRKYISVKLCSFFSIHIDLRMSHVCYLKEIRRCKPSFICVHLLSVYVHRYLSFWIFFFLSFFPGHILENDFAALCVAEFTHRTSDAIKKNGLKKNTLCKKKTWLKKKTLKKFFFFKYSFKRNYKLTVA